MRKKISHAKVQTDSDFASIVAAFASSADVHQKKMFSSSSVLTANGKIFAMLVRGKLVVKLPKDRVNELVASGKGDNFDPGHGRLMKEWLATAMDRPGWVALATEAYRFVKSAGTSKRHRKPVPAASRRSSSRRSSAR